MTELLLLAGVSAVATVGALAKSAYHAVCESRINSDPIGHALGKLYDETLKEPVPKDMLDKLRGLE